MSKKTRDMQVIVKEEKVTFQGKQVEGSTLWFGKQLMGTIIQAERGYLCFAEDESNIFKAKHFDECAEFLIKDWNLHHN